MYINMKKYLEQSKKRIIFVLLLTKPLTMKFSVLSFRDWKHEDLFKKFLRDNPRFNNAIIIRHAIEDNFGIDYQYEESWTVEIKNRFYNVILNDPWRDWERGRKQKAGFIFKRFYREDETPIKKIKFFSDYKREHTGHSVARTTSYNNDCQIWTLAKCCGLTYDDAAKALHEVGWTAKRTNYFYFPRALGLLGFQYKEIWRRFSVNKGITLRHIQKIIPAQGTFSVTVKQHILCVVDGIIYDSAFNPNARVGEILEITKKEEI